MCHPVAFMAMAIGQQMQAQQAQDAQIGAANAAAQKNAELQTEAYQNDMASAYAEEINIEKEGYKSAEDAASAKLDMLVMAREDQARLQAQNFETIGGGQTADAIMGNLRRHIANNVRDLEDNFQRGVVSRRQERGGITRDRISRRLQYKSSLHSMPIQSYASGNERALKMGGAAFQGYSGYKSYTKVDPAADAQNIG
tara:strand:- start:1026 stop:1619 length:594 start_codon:yes stop_codon:yes gene_type:complete